jgi:O-antigen/teichoic acid export membrane protein
MLPLATRVLGPADYGILALASAYTGFGTALASLGGGYVVAARFHADGRSDLSQLQLMPLAFMRCGHCYRVWNTYR